MVFKHKETCAQPHYEKERGIRIESHNSSGRIWHAHIGGITPEAEADDRDRGNAYIMAHYEDLFPLWLQ